MIIDMRDFGVIVGCYRQDYLFAKATCSSIRHGMGDIPITLLVDGRFPINELSQLYEVRALYREDVRNEFLRTTCTGWGLPKMIAFWESPYEKFLYLDADTVVWGDLMTKLKRMEDVDIITDQPACSYTESDVDKWFFQHQRIEALLPSFDWRRHCNDYFCTGVFCATRDMFDLEEFRMLLELARREPNLFFPGDMGLLNLMIFRAHDEGRIKLHKESLQTICIDHEKASLERSFPANLESADFTSHAPTALHYPGIKPLLRCKTHSGPMSHFRAQLLRDSGLQNPFNIHARLQTEDLAFCHRRRVADIKSRWVKFVKK